MKDQLYAVPIRKKNGQIKIIRFPMEGQTYKAISSLPYDQQVIYFTMEYEDYWKEKAHARYEIPFSSLSKSEKELLMEKATYNEDGWKTSLENERVLEAIKDLSDRQREVVILLWEGKTKSQIARALQIDESTVRIYKKRAKRHLEAAVKSLSEEISE